VHGRVFETKEEYDQAIHDFLNENWLCNTQGSYLPLSSLYSGRPTPCANRGSAHHSPQRAPWSTIVTK
jgi:hypothetical protein